MTEMFVVPSFVQRWTRADALGGGHDCRPGTVRKAAVLSDMW